MRKLPARSAVGAILALLLGSSGGASPGILETRRAIDIVFMIYEPDPDHVQGTCYYECTVEVTTSELVMMGDGEWRRVESVSYEGEETTKPTNADGQDCPMYGFMPKVPECPSGT
jgi:hypothetical protein